MHDHARDVDLTAAWATAFNKPWAPLTPSQRRHFADGDVGGDPAVTEIELRRSGESATESDSRHMERYLDECEARREQEAWA